eukprot:scaffold40142_cov69-Phaeocystis_antarctica.AAC.1
MPPTRFQHASCYVLCNCQHDKARTYQGKTGVHSVTWRSQFTRTTQTFARLSRDSPTRPEGVPGERPLRRPRERSW